LQLPQHRLATDNTQPPFILPKTMFDHEKTKLTSFWAFENRESMDYWLFAGVD
jgi:hypothetical protein